MLVFQDSVHKIDSRSAEVLKSQGAGAGNKELLLEGALMKCSRAGEREPLIPSSSWREL